MVVPMESRGSRVWWGTGCIESLNNCSWVLGAGCWALAKESFLRNEVFLHICNRSYLKAGTEVEVSRAHSVKRKAGVCCSQRRS